MNMKAIRNIRTSLLLIGSVLFAACSDFEEINIDPKAATVEQVQVEYIINNSITGAQQNPHVAERAFILYWKTAARQHRVNGSLALGGYSDGWSNDYYNSLTGWLKSSNLAVEVADEKIANGSDLPYTENLKQIARIWRVYLMSEFSDNFGPMPLDGFQGNNPSFKNVESVYDYMLTELKSASEGLNMNVEIPSDLSKFDKAYGFDLLKWQKYANSMRMRLAMRLSEVAPARAQAEFEDAVSGEILLNADEIFKVAEKPGWDDLTGVMSREWNSQPLSSTLNNLYIGLGGIDSETLLPNEMHGNIKPDNWIGQKYENHLTTMTNDPSAGFWLDGLPKKIDPRAYKAFIVPGDFDNENFSSYPSWTNDATTTVRNLVDADGEEVVEIDGAYTWNAAPLGDWGDKSARNNVSFYTGTNPRLSQRFRASTSERIFFAPWETYFLIAEAAVRGWNTPMGDQTAYEEGIASSFEYWGVSDHLGTYMASEEYNRAGTSVSWSHDAEPVSPVIMNYENGYNGEEGTYEFNYPQNHLYENGEVSNDHLTKIITQKYLAQLPWLPLEAWNDHRRLGLPFFENPAVDRPITNLPGLSPSNYMTSKIEFFPQRLKYPSGLQNTNPDGYEQALQHLGGEDAVLTPLWWAQQE